MKILLSILLIAHHGIVEAFLRPQGRTLTPASLTQGTSTELRGAYVAGSQTIDRRGQDFRRDDYRYRDQNNWFSGGLWGGRSNRRDRYLNNRSRYRDYQYGNIYDYNYDNYGRYNSNGVYDQGEGVIVDRDGRRPFYESRERWDNEILVQGEALRTFSLAKSVERVEIKLKSDGRPLQSDMDLWCGPDNSPTKIRVFIDDAQERVFQAVVETLGPSNSLAIRNTAPMEYPMFASVEAQSSDTYSSKSSIPAFGAYSEQMSEESFPEMIQGTSIKTYPFDEAVDFVHVLLQTDGRPLNARLELLQGPDTNKQVIEVYTENGLERPFFCVLECPGAGNVLRVVNSAQASFPMNVRVEAYEHGYRDPVSVSGMVRWWEAIRRRF